MDLPGKASIFCGLCFGAGLLKISLKQTLQTTAVASLVASHLMDGVVDRIQTVLLSAGCQFIGSVDVTANSAYKLFPIIFL